MADRYYRFAFGPFMQAKTFEEAKTKMIEKIQKETEEPNAWCDCTCVGFDHRFDCPEKDKEGIPF